MGFEEEKSPAEEEEEDKNLAEEEDKDLAAQPKIGSGAEKSCNDEKTQEPIDSGAEKSCNDKDDSAMVPAAVEGHNGAEQTGLLVVPEETDASKNQQMKNKEKKRKMVELHKIKKEQQLGNDKKTQVHVIAEEPVCDTKHIGLLTDPEEEKNAHMKKKRKKMKRMEHQKIKKEQQLGSIEKTQVSIDSEERATAWRWHASYSLKIHVNKPNLYEGSIFLQAEVKRVVLLDSDETVVDAYHLKEGESVHPGSVFGFPCHKVDIGERILQPDVCIEDEVVAATTEQGTENENEKSTSKKDEKRMRLKRKPQPMRSPQAALLRSSIGMFARVASSRKGISPQAKLRKSESPSIPNVTTHFPSPNFPQRHRPRKLKSQIWKDFIPIYEHERLAQGRCKHCHEVFVASQSSGTNHIRRHVRTCVVRSNMYDMVAKLRASASSPQVATLDGWNFCQEDSRRNLANMIVQHGLPFSIVQYNGFIKFVKSLNPMFKMVSRTTIKEDCMESYKEQRSML